MTRIRNDAESRHYREHHKQLEDRWRVITSRPVEFGDTEEIGQDNIKGDYRTRELVRRLAVQMVDESTRGPRPKPSTRYLTAWTTASGS